MNINFYIFEEAKKQKALLFTCQLIKDMYDNNQHVYIHTPTREEAQYFDALLWTYKEDSFIPHQIQEQHSDTYPPVQIGFDIMTPNEKDVLINLAKEIPPFYDQYHEVIEIVFSDPTVQQWARERYRQYRNQNHIIHVHKMK